jgi:hypothetical protein
LTTTDYFSATNKKGDFIEQLRIAENAERMKEGMPA